MELGEVACHVYAELSFRPRRGAPHRGLAGGIDRHPMLRAVVERDGTQRILAETRSRSPSRGEGEAAAAAAREEMSHQVLPSDRWPLFEVRVTRVTPEDWRLHLSIDALILDGESNNLLLEEVFDLYHGQRPAGRAVTFRDYVLCTQAQSLAESRAGLWEARLESLPPAPACRFRSILRDFAIRASAGCTPPRCRHGARSRREPRRPG